MKPRIHHVSFSTDMPETRTELGMNIITAAVVRPAQSMKGRGLRLAALVVAVMLLLLLSLFTPALAAASNPIVLENQQPGSTQWQLGLPGFQTSFDDTGQIKGYASAASINKGQSITFSVSVNPAQTYTIDIYRVGWYQGKGGRLMQHVGPLNGTQQAACPVAAVTGELECSWSPSYTLS